MGQWDLSFDYAAVFVLTIIFVWIFVEKKVPLKSYSLFFVFMVAIYSATAVAMLIPS